jgi:hypothetical protein
MRKQLNDALQNVATKNFVLEKVGEEDSPFNKKINRLQDEINLKLKLKQSVEVAEV